MVTTGTACAGCCPETSQVMQVNVALPVRRKLVNSGRDVYVAGVTFIGGPLRNS